MDRKAHPGHIIVPENGNNAFGTTDNIEVTASYKNMLRV